MYFQLIDNTFLFVWVIFKYYNIYVINQNTYSLCFKVQLTCENYCKLTITLKKLHSISYSYILKKF